MKSRKTVAEKFQTWVFDVIKEIRLNGFYTLQSHQKQLGKSEYIIEEFHNRPVAYIGQVEETPEHQIVKYGHTADIKSTLKRHRDSYGENFNFLYAKNTTILRKRSKVTTISQLDM